MEEQVPGSAMPPQAQGQASAPTPQMPNFEAMRQLAMQQAIEQITAQRTAQPQQQPSAPPQAPPGMELSMDGLQFIPKKYPDTVSQPVPNAQVTEQVRVVRRNLTRPELLAVFIIACIAVTGVQAAWNFTTNILPRIEIRAN